MKKFMIRCDMEGVTGIVSYEQAEPGKSEYEEGRRLFMSDLNAAIKGLHDGGADEIHIYDEHFYGRNIILDEIPEYVYTYCGKPNYTIESAGGLDESFTGMILLGFHSKAGTENALLNHTYEPDIADINLNGISVGEIGMEGAVAGSFGVPILMYTGDSEGALEMKKLSPDTICVNVKESLSENGAVCFPASMTYKMIYDAAYKIAKDTPSAAPLNFGETELIITFRDTPYAAKYYELYGYAPITGENANVCWVEYLRRKAKVKRLI
jgi:D-amino peptidase